MARIDTPSVGMGPAVVAAIAVVLLGIGAAYFMVAPQPDSPQNPTQVSVSAEQESLAESRRHSTEFLKLEEPVLDAPAEAARSATEWQAMIGSSGRIQISHKGKKVATLSPGLYDTKWRGKEVGGVGGAPEDPAVVRGTITSPDGITVDSVLKWKRSDKGVRLSYSLTPTRSARLNSLHVSMDMPISFVAGRDFTVDGESNTVPKTFADNIHLASKPMKSVDLDLAVGRKMSLRFTSPTHVLVQDNRRWGPSLALRMGDQSGPSWAAGSSMKFEVELTAEGGLSVDRDMPVTIEEGRDWVPLEVELDVVKGSALDFEHMRPTGAPAGKSGWILARDDGHFVFEKKRDEPLRFYGVNLCFSAHYMPHEQADQLSERLARLGYNALRIHHHEGELISTPSAIDAIAADAPPTSTATLSQFEARPDEREHYASRARGFLYPPRTGDYVFHVAGDDEVKLFLSADETPVNKRAVATAPSWTSFQQWDRHPAQKSRPVRLEKGTKYYVEALHAQAVGGSHFSVGWSTGDGIIEVIPGTCLSPFEGGGKGSIMREVWRSEARADSLTINPKKMDQLDYLFSALKKRGIYITTDLYVSRPVLATELWPGAPGRVEMNDFKMAVPVNERAWENWKEFSRRLLTHVNPYTGMSWAKDPTLAWLSMINEGNVGNFIGRVDERVRKDWEREWNKWLLKTYSSRDAIQHSWSRDPGGDPAGGTVPLFANPYDDSPRGRDLAAFLADVERSMFVRMRDFLRNEIGTKALLTNNNGWTNRLAAQTARTEFDYVDDHFYVDHPQWIDKQWQLPSKCPNTSPIADGAPGGRHTAFVRLLDKPFTISEYNYSGPGRFRGVGGIITGVLAATQDWSIVWRFTYSHSNKSTFTPRPAGYFDLVTDPLNQAAERASLCLFLRRDMKSANRTIAIAATEDELVKTRRRNVNAAPGWHALALVARVGTHVTQRPGRVPADVVMPVAWDTTHSQWSGGEVLTADPYSGEAGAAALATLRRKGWLENNITDLGKNILQNESRQLTIDAPADKMTLDTDMTAGGYAPQGSIIKTKAVTVDIRRTDATVWVSSVDGKPITTSRRLIMTHLTDLQNTGCRFGEHARQTLLAWGSTPHLVRTGSAEASIELADADEATVYALSTSGRRIARIKTTVRDGALVVPLVVAGPGGARMIYEIAFD